MDFSVIIVNLLSFYQLPAIFWGAFFFGETVVITAAFLSAQGIWSLLNVFWLALAGTLISDALWFLFGKSFLKLLNRWQRYQQKHDKFVKKLERILGRRPFLVLLFIKFLYGTRILTIIYLSLRKIRFRTFLIFNTIGTLVWLVVMIAIGWLAGKGIANVIPVFHRIGYALSLLVLFLIIFKVITSWLGKRIIKK